MTAQAASELSVERHLARIRTVATNGFHGCLLPHKGRFWLAEAQACMSALSALDYSVKLVKLPWRHRNFAGAYQVMVNW